MLSVCVCVCERERERERERRTDTLGVRGSNPEPAEAKLTPVKSSLMLRVGSKYGGIDSLIPIYEADYTNSNIN